MIMPWQAEQIMEKWFQHLLFHITGMAGAWYGPGHNEKWVEDAEPTPLIAMPWLEFHIKSARP